MTPTARISCSEVPSELFPAIIIEIQSFCGTIAASDPGKSTTISLIANLSIAEDVGRWNVLRNIPFGRALKTLRTAPSGGGRLAALLAPLQTPVETIALDHWIGESLALGWRTGFALIGICDEEPEAPSGVVPEITYSDLEEPVLS